MGRIVINRAVPFQRGDMSISIYVDGKAAGTLLSNNELSIELPAGQHELRPFCNGGPGKRYQVKIGAGEELHLQVVSPTPKTFWWHLLILPFIWGVPADKLGKYGLFIQIGLYALLFGIVLAVKVPQMRNMLHIEPLPQEAADKMQMATG